MRTICPGCRTPLPASRRPACPVCDLALTGPAAAELWTVDVQLHHLVRHRRALLAHLYAPDARPTGATTRPAPGTPADPLTAPPHGTPADPLAGPVPGSAAGPLSGPAPGSAAGFASGWSAWWSGGDAAGPGAGVVAGAAGGAGVGGPDVSRVAVRNVLLGVGGAMLGVAAVVFTALTWTTLGPGGRALLLLALTVLTLSAAAAVARRGLAATAETVALLGLLLIALETSAAYASGFGDLDRLDPQGYAAGVMAAVAAGWAGYGRFVGLRLAAPTALLVAQPVAPLAAAALGAGPSGMALSLLAVSAADLAVRSAAARTATVAGLFAGFAGTAVALVHACSVAPDAYRSAAVLVVAAGVALAWAHRFHPAFAGVAGVLPPVAVTTVLPLPGRWLPAGAALAAVAALAAARFAPARLRTAASAGAGVALAGCAVWILPAAGAAVLRPAARLEDPWSGTTAFDLGAWAADLGLWTSPAAPLVLALVLAVLLVAGFRPPAPAAALLVVLTTPGLPFGVLLAVVLAAAAGLAGWAVLDRTARPAAGAAAIAAACWAVAESLASQEATLIVLAAVTVLAAGFAALPVLRDGAAAVAVLALAGGAAAGSLAAGLDPAHAAFPVLGAAALGLLAAPALRAAPDPLGAPPARARSADARGVPVEVAAWAVAATGVALAAGRAAELSLALAIAGVLAFGAAIRADRRRAAWAGPVLLVAAWWVRLGASGITVPEAYTLPVSAALLVIGAVRRSRGTAANSWTAYGAGLTATLGPSLAAAWTDPGGPRPLLLGIAAFVLVLAGARARLQAPLVLGAAVLLLDAARWLGPYAWEALAALPGWAPIAVLGLVLLLTGATYERRLRDLRRLRAALARLG